MTLQELILDQFLEVMRAVLTFVFDVAHRLMDDTEPHVQKGLGWMPKATSVSRREAVLSLAERHGHEMPRTALRYAVEKMPRAMRRIAMERGQRAMHHSPPAHEPADERRAGLET